MLAATLALLLLCTGLTLASVWQWRRNRRAGLEVRCQLARIVGRKRKRELELLELRNRRRLLEDTVNGSTAAVEMIHRTISSTTFEMFERFSSSEKTRENARQARLAHDQASSGIYRTLRSTNKAFHALANVVIDSRAGKKSDNEGKPEDRE